MRTLRFVGITSLLLLSSASFGGVVVKVCELIKGPVDLEDPVPFSKEVQTEFDGYYKQMFDANPTTREIAALRMGELCRQRDGQMQVNDLLKKEGAKKPANRGVLAALTLAASKCGPYVTFSQSQARSTVLGALLNFCYPGSRCGIRYSAFSGSEKLVTELADQIANDPNTKYDRFVLFLNDSCKKLQIQPIAEKSTVTYDDDKACSCPDGVAPAPVLGGNLIIPGRVKIPGR